MVGMRLGMLVLMVLWAYCVFDVIRSPDGLIRELPKMIWLVIVFFFPLIGSVAWLLLGRPEGASFADPTRPKDTPPQPFRGTFQLPPDEDPDFLRRAEQRAHELKRQEELRRWEEERRRRSELGGADHPELEDGSDPP